MKAELIKEKFNIVFFMVAVTFVAITLVGLVDAATRDAVARNRTLFLKQAVSDASGHARPESIDALLAWYDAHVEEHKDAQGEYDFFWVKPAPEAASENLVLIQKGPGLWGTITAFIGFNEDASAFKGVTFQDHVETPGLGARIDEPWFRGQFVGKTGPFRTMGVEPQNKENLTEDDNKFDQITGATVTSTAVKEIMNNSLQRARQLAGNR